MNVSTAYDDQEKLNKVFPTGRNPDGDNAQHLAGGSPSLFAWFNFLDILLPFPTQRLPLPFRSTPSSQRYTFLSLFFSIPTAFAVPLNATAEFNGRHAPLYPPQNKAGHIPRWSVDPFFFWKQFRVDLLDSFLCGVRHCLTGILSVERNGSQPLTQSIDDLISHARYSTQ
ncbi:Uncharacterized protein APZ42_015217 [Daphnia magna]|uniref:Uncharacterized protein n=1 Tax=Daphnia magna TaxID=35525 RepID=A0A162PA08_9CRUS|nr:Uncharacterized protein APZ42_015217 [Daphnia magna]